MRLTCVGVALLLATGPARAQFLVLTQDIRAIVVHEAEPVGETIRAYEDLALYLGRATGVDIAIASEDESTEMGVPTLYVGRCRALPPESRTAGNHRRWNAQGSLQYIGS